MAGLGAAGVAWRALDHVRLGDLVGFTRTGEQFTPAGVVNLLSRHITLPVDAIQACHGVVDRPHGPRAEGSFEKGGAISRLVDSNPDCF